MEGFGGRGSRPEGGVGGSDHYPDPRTTRGRERQLPAVGRSPGPELSGAIGTEGMGSTYGRAPEDMERVTQLHVRGGTITEGESAGAPRSVPSERPSDAIKHRSP